MTLVLILYLEKLLSLYKIVKHKRPSSDEIEFGQHTLLLLE